MNCLLGLSNLLNRLCGLNNGGLDSLLLRDWCCLDRRCSFLLSLGGGFWLWDILGLHLSSKIIVDLCSSGEHFATDGNGEIQFGEQGFADALFITGKRRVKAP